MNPTQARARMIAFLDTVAGVTDTWPLWTQDETQALRIVLGLEQIGTLLHHDDLIIGKRYRIVHKSGTEKLPRESVMGFLGRDINGELMFNARPIAGTQTMPLHWIISIVEAPAGVVVYLNKIVRKPR